MDDGDARPAEERPPIAYRAPPERPAPRPQPIARPRPVPVVTAQVKRQEKKKPAPLNSRLKWIKKCTTFKHKQFDRATFKSNLERRRQAMQNQRNKAAVAVAVANGDHRPSEAQKPPAAAAADDCPSSSTSAGAAQPSVTFKCRKCSSTTFENLETLKEHQLRCSSSSETAPEAEAAPGARAVRQVVLCSACGVYYENWNLYVHMKDVHGRHICLFCLGLFSQAEKLASHLVAKHGARERRFETKDQLGERFPETYYVMCVKCEVKYEREEDFLNHPCSPAEKRCSTCDTVGGHRPDCLKRHKKLKKNPPGANFGEFDLFGDFEPDPEGPATDAQDGYADLFANGYPPTDGAFDAPAYSAGSLDFSTCATPYRGASLPYSTPDVKTDKISPDALAQLIEEVKNCVSSGPPPSESIKSPEPEDVVNTNNKDKLIESAPSESRPPEDSLNRVPKLTVKLNRRKKISERESSECSSGSEDSDKLTVDLEAGEEPDGLVPGEAAAEPIEPDVAGTENPTESEPVVPAEDAPVIELMLDRPLDRYPLKELLEVLLNASVYSCIYCNHARKIAVNGKQLGLHFMYQHKFTATVDSITAEELLPETIVSKIKSCLPDVENEHVNLARFDTIDADARPPPQTYECFQCYYVTTVHKDLYFHNRKMHQKTILLCIMCKTNFYTYSELVCHLCPGTYATTVETRFQCCLCRSDAIPSAFRLMVHLRKRHLACDVCLETCSNQSKLSVHVWKHKLHHLCYRCGIAYRNKPDIKKHLFWKHGTESALCKKCLQKKWPHVYHFCVPPASFACDECNSNFSKAVYLKVHKRSHANEYPHVCDEPECSEKFISRNLLKKHKKIHTEAASRAETEKQKALDASFDNVIDITGAPDDKDVAGDALGNAAPVTKSKRSKKSKYKDSKDLLMEVNLPELNLSESGSSDDSDAETKPDGPAVTDGDVVDLVDDPQTKSDAVEANPEPVAGIWDNFKLYQESLEKPKPKHVCDSDHDYCVIPSDDSPDVEIVGEIKPKTEHVAKDSPKKKRNKKKKDAGSSSSDSSSDSDTTCSGGSDCSCCSSSGSSSSSSSSGSSLASRSRKNDRRKDSDASHSAVDIMATGDSPARVAPKTAEFSIAETDLDTEESASDEDFYDEHPEKIASKLLAEKRNQLMQLASTSPVNNGTYVEPPLLTNSQEQIEKPKKKVKIKKKKKEKRQVVTENPTIFNTESVNIPQRERIEAPQKITITFQSNKMQANESPPAAETMQRNAAAMLEADSKRASKRRRVPNKFYGYSSDEEYAIKSHPPAKMEWCKEEISSPIPTLIDVHEAPPPPLRIPTPEPPPVEPILPKVEPKESSSEDSDSSKEGVLQIKDSYSPIMREQESFGRLVDAAAAASVLDTSIPFPRPAGAREAREGESVYCYCRCPYDEVSEMIACDADGCAIEWFHFECVGIMVPPKGKWFCPDCRLKVDNFHK